LTGDATAGASSTHVCDGTGASLVAPVCNRGADSIGAGLSVGFYVNGQLVCSAKTSAPIFPNDCELVSCTWANPPATQDAAVDVVVTPNNDGAYAECKPGNNNGTILGVFCKPAG
jgi:hypothetical protein